MPGTRQGGIKARETNLRKHGEDFFIELGRKGGSAPYKGKKGYAANPELARKSGAIGGAISKRGKSKAKKQPTTPKPVHKFRLKRLLHLDK